MSRFERIGSYLRRHRLLIVGLVASSIVAALLEGFGMTLFFPILQGMTGDATKQAATNVPWPFDTAYVGLMGLSIKTRLQLVACILFGLTVIKSILLYASIVCSARLTVRVIRHYRDDCNAQLMRVGMSFLNRQRLSDLQVLVDGYTESTAGAIVGLVGSSLPLLFTMSWLLILLFILSWKLSIVSIVLMSLATLALGSLSRRITQAGRDIIDRRYKFTRVLYDILYGMKIVRLFDRQGLMTERFKEADVAYNHARYRAAKLLGTVTPVFEVVGIGVLAAILIVGSLLIGDNSSVWLGVLLTFILILARLILPVRQLNQMRASISEKLPTLYELDAFLDGEDKGYMETGGEFFGGLVESIEFRDVTFGYVPEDAVVLRRMSFTVPKGARVGVVGPSGSGKSTITELLLRFYDPQEGGVFVDGRDLRCYEVGSWRRCVGVVTQDTFLFHASILDNIRFAKPDATDGEVEQAAKRAYAHDFISAMPKGYDTVVGDRGVLISGGQRQRIAIARAILGEPEVLVFDEATSALDTESEQIVQEALDAVAEGRTVITIAHRLSTVADSDLILVIDDGKIIESGAHCDLMAKYGLYRKLVQRQAIEGSDTVVDAGGDSDGA